MSDGEPGAEFTTADSTWIICNYYLDPQKMVKHIEGDYAVWRCEECDKNTLIAKFANGNAGCVNESCDEIQPWMNQLQFIAKFDPNINDGDTRKANRKRREILGGHLEQQKEEARIEEAQKIQELEQRVESLEGDKSSLQRQLSSANQSRESLKSELDETAADRDGWKQSADNYYQELQRVNSKQESVVLREGVNGGLYIGLATLVGMCLWLFLFLGRAGVSFELLGKVLVVVISLGYAALAGTGFYQSAREAYRNGRVWEPFYQRIEPRRVMWWLINAGVVLGGSYILAGWALEVELLTSRMPPGETAWTLISSIIAMILPVAFVVWAFRD